MYASRVGWVSHPTERNSTVHITSHLVAIDPDDCGCTECLIGEYKPLRRATADDIQALFLGILRDNTCTTWDIAQRLDGKFTVSADGYTFTIAKIALPITVDRYTVDLFPDTAATYRHRLGPNATDTTPVVLGTP